MLEPEEVLAIDRNGGRNRQLVWRGAAKGNITGAPSRRNFTRIDFISQIAINDIAGPSRRTDRTGIRVDTGNSGQDPVRMGEVEPTSLASAVIDAAI